MIAYVRIFWDGRAHVQVKASTEWKGKLCGLCGNYNSDSTDDFWTPEEGLATTANSFGNSWLYNDSSSSKVCAGLPNPPVVLDPLKQWLRTKLMQNSQRQRILAMS